MNKSNVSVLMLLWIVIVTVLVLTNTAQPIHAVVPGENMTAPGTIMRTDGVKWVLPINPYFCELALVRHTITDTTDDAFLGDSYSSIVDSSDYIIKLEISKYKYASSGVVNVDAHFEFVSLLKNDRQFISVCD